MGRRTGSSTGSRRLARRRALEGLLVAPAVPLGWLVLNVARGVPPVVELRDDVLLYAYLLVSSALAFASYGYFLGRLEDRLEAGKAALERLSRTDPLTNLQNLRAFREALEGAVSFARRTESPLSVLMLDLDHFKQVNDRFGHPVGDDLLRQVASSIRVGRRLEDVLARVGGEEFAVLLPGLRLREAEVVAQRILEAMRNLRFAPGGNIIPTTISIGVAELLANESGHEMLKRADDALYSAKRTGRDRFVSASFDDLETRLDTTRE